MSRSSGSTFCARAGEAQNRMTLSSPRKKRLSRIAVPDLSGGVFAKIMKVFIPWPMQHSPQVCVAIMERSSRQRAAGNNWLPCGKRIFASPARFFQRRVEKGGRPLFQEMSPRMVGVRPLFVFRRPRTFFRHPPFSVARPLFIQRRSRSVFLRPLCSEQRPLFLAGPAQPAKHLGKAGKMACAALHARQAAPGANHHDSPCAHSPGTPSTRSPARLTPGTIPIWEWRQGATA